MAKTKPNEERFDVTQEHIDDSDRGDANSCALAMCLLENGKNKPNVGQGTIYFKHRGKEYEFKTCPTVSEFIQIYDEFDPEEPFDEDVAPCTLILNHATGKAHIE